jgi:hypothetical protein
VLPLIIAPSAARYFKKIKDMKLKTLFGEKILEIRQDPHLGKAKKGDLEGIFSCDLFFNKTNYEIAYTITDGEPRTIVVVLAGTRENFYEELKRRWSTGKYV